MERALELESRGPDYRPTSCGLMHIIHLISLGLTFPRNFERVSCSFSPRASASSTETLDVRTEYIQDCRAS